MLELLSPWSWSVPSLVLLTNLEASFTPYFGFLWRRHHLGEINYYLHFELLFPLWRMRGGAQNSKLPTIAWSVTSLHPGVHQESPPHQSRRHSHHPGNSKGFSSSVSGTRVKRPTINRNQAEANIYIYNFCLLFHRNLKRKYSRVERISHQKPGNMGLVCLCSPLYSTVPLCLLKNLSLRVSSSSLQVPTSYDSE